MTHSTKWESMKSIVAGTWRVEKRNSIVFYVCTRTDPRALTKQRGDTDMIYVAPRALVSWTKAGAQVGIDCNGFVAVYRVTHAMTVELVTRVMQWLFWQRSSTAAGNA